MSFPRKEFALQTYSRWRPGLDMVLGLLATIRTCSVKFRIPNIYLCWAFEPRRPHSGKPLLANQHLAQHI